MNLRKATTAEVPAIWTILQAAVAQRKADGSKQWQDGYPNEQTILDDIAKGYAYVLVAGEELMAYAAIIFDIEPAYEGIEGRWLTDGDYAVVHRVATAPAAKGKGIATGLFRMIEGHCLAQQVNSIKVDTNFDNIPMLKILDRLGYTYCGEVYFRGSARKAFEKVLS
ncbi:GNAT family N-acetyltransferase [Taibaiella chishuiensis]|uniref:L-amino acid N-acyltransferase YncA n=1 Tax=Taibaiella chishuiensis TaxID=1434707 RepID=A0A2P8DBV3_9BACT|nr:GNAT family N-acetyltransferase [Taibaiella chishuiensis]PSK94699.1 L-amino acid N-acyltransferase YncA [Taibaiella chishuiensis]